MDKLPMLTKSFVGFSIFLAIPLIIAGSIFNYNMIRYSENEISKSSVINLQNVKKLNDQLVDSITKQSIRLSLDVVLQDIGGINDYHELRNNVDNMLKLSKVHQILIQTSNINFRIQSIYIYLEEANYIITSNRGFLLKEEFRDTAWIKQYEASKKTAIGTLWLDSRPIDGLNLKPGDNNNVLTFILPLRTLMVNYDGAVVVNVYERELYNLLNDTAYEKEGSVIIINNKGTVISHSDKQLIGRSLSDRQHIKNILLAGDTTGYFIDGAGSESRMYSFYKSEFNNWIYVGVMSMESLVRKTEAMRNGIFLLIIILMLSGVVFSYFFSKNMYNPVKKLMNEIQKHKGTDLREKGNEMAVLSRVFDSLAKQADNLTRALETNRQALRDKYLTDLLKGDALSSGAEGPGELCFFHDCFVCALISIDRYETFSDKYSTDEQYYMKMMILKACEEVTRGSFDVYGVPYEKNKLAVILNCGRDAARSVHDTLHKSFTALQGEISKVLSNSISIGIGGCYEGEKSIGLSFSEAQEALKNRIIKGGGSIIFHRDIGGCESGYFYPYNLEKRILNLLRLGSKQEVLDAIRELTDQIRGRKGLSHDNIHQIFIQLIGNTVRFLVESNINISNIFGNDYNIYQKLSSKETLDEIQVWLMGFYSAVIQYMADSRDTGNSHADRVMDYIHKNYKMNIDTTSIADNTGVGYSSVGRIVKNRTGKNVLEYINSLRIEEAKRLLKQSNMNLTAVALNVGYNNDQSFSRFFKKFEGITPGEFRSMR